MSGRADANVAPCLLALLVWGCGPGVEDEHVGGAETGTGDSGDVHVDGTETEGTDTADELDLGWLEDIEQPLPERLSEVGVFADLEQLEPSPAVLVYEPLWPLYSNDAEKLRFLALPEGETIETGESWAFPVGTVLVKTFTFDDLETSAGTVPIETRLLFRRAGGWDYALYQWNEDRDDAMLLEDPWTEVPLEIPRVGDPSFPYVLPARLDCRTCHETSETRTGSPVLGIGPYQTDAELASSSAFASPPSAAPIEGRSVDETLAFGYFIGNCVSCHHGGGGTNASFSLYPDDVLEQTIDQPTQGEALGGIRVVPGDAEASAVFIAVVLAREPGFSGELKPMPPIGITRTDSEADTILRNWIENL